MTSLSDRSRSGADATIRSLKDEYGEFEVVEKTRIVSPSPYQATGERVEDGSVGGAGVWLQNENGEVLLVRNEGDEGWGDPGGKAEIGESFGEVAMREVREETGVECRLTDVLEVHVVEIRSGTGDNPPVFEPIVIFTGEYTAGDPRPREGEIAQVDWFSSPPANVLYEEMRTRPYR
jgi:ADP-ribose pyrophosphatase YjhB (NUDIX family)